LGWVGGGPLGGELDCGEVAKGGVGPLPVAVTAPVLNEHAGFAEAVQLPSVEKFVTEPAIGGLYPDVLPRRAGRARRKQLLETPESFAQHANGAHKRFGIRHFPPRAPWGSTRLTWPRRATSSTEHSPARALSRVSRSCPSSRRNKQTSDTTPSAPQCRCRSDRPATRQMRPELSFRPIC